MNKFCFNIISILCLLFIIEHTYACHSIPYVLHDYQLDTRNISEKLTTKESNYKKNTNLLLIIPTHYLWRHEEINHTSSESNLTIRTNRPDESLKIATRTMQKS